MLSKSEVLDMDIPSVTYYQNCQSASNMALAGSQGLGDVMGEYLSQSQSQWLKPSVNLMPLTNYLGLTTPAQPVTEKREEIVARLIRYTVVDPSPVLAEKKPDNSILMEGRVMLNGQDDRGFLMELAPKLAELLQTHNTVRESVEFEDKEGKTKKLKPIKLSNLDVIIELLKEYK